MPRLVKYKTRSFFERFPKSAGSWVTLLGAVALIISAIILGFTGGREGVIADFLMNAGLFLGLHKFGSVANHRADMKYGQPTQDCPPPALEPLNPDPPTADVQN